MSRFLERNEIIHLDAYNWNRKREPDMPLISQLATDLMNNGFVDVGPEIVKITCTDDQLTRYIDNVIVYYYDSNTDVPREGAFGLTVNDTADPTDQTFTALSVHGNPNTTKNIQDSYDDDDWSNWLAVDYPSSQSLNALDPATQANVKTGLGPNCELFAYLNPHPNKMDQEGNFLKKRPDAAVPNKQTQNQFGYFGLSYLAEKVYDNEFKKIKRLITTGARNVVFYPDENSGIDSTGNLRNYKMETLVNGDILHHFWISTYRDEKFFPPTITSPEAWEGRISFGLNPDASNGFEYGDKYTVTMDSFPLGNPTSISTSTVDVTINTQNLEEFTEQMYEEFLKSDIAGLVSGELYAELETDSSGNIYLTNNRDARNVQFTIQRTPYTPLDKEDITGNPADSGLDMNASVSTSLNANGALTLINGERISTSAIGGALHYGLIGEEYTQTYQAALDSATVGDAYPWWNQGERFSRFSSSTTTKGKINTTRYGYVHTVDIKGFEGANPGDTFDIQIDGLINEESDEPWNNNNKTVNIQYNVDKPIASKAALTLELASAMAKDPYIKKYMRVKAQGSSGVIRLEYDKASSAYMVRAERDKRGNDGLFNLPSTVWANAVTNGYFDSAVNGPQAQENLEYWQGSGFSNGIPYPLDIVGDGSEVGTDIYKIDGSDVPIKYVVPTRDVQLGYKDAFFWDDVPPEAQFETTVTYNKFTTAGVDSVLMEVEVVQEPQESNVSNVRLSFPLARDMGTYANPVSSPNWGAYLGLSSSIRANYPLSYYYAILSDTTATTKEDRPDGPQLGFDYSLRDKHPNVTHGTQDLAKTENADFSKHIGELEIMTFEYVTDYSMGPLVFETSSNSTLSGQDGDQPWRIRIDVSRGFEIKDASPYISDAHLEIQDMESDPSVIRDRQFEYLQFHVATQYQLLSNGEVTKPQGRDVRKPAVDREPGYLGALRPQYTGYVRSNTHTISPFVSRELLDPSIRMFINVRAGRVGYYHDSNEGFTGTSIGTVFDNRQGIVDDVARTTPDGNTTITIEAGLLENNEYRYEEQFLMGTSTELLYDTPYNKGDIRLQKGFFRRTGKAFADVSPSYPITYTMTFADHGMVFSIKDQASATQSDDNAWFVVQRHVDSTTGEADFTSETQPLHCIYQTSEPPLLYSDLNPFFTTDDQNRLTSIGYTGIYDIDGNYITDFYIDKVISDELTAFDIEGQGRFRRFVVREKDTLKPWDRHVFAGLNERDSHAVLNPLEQLSLNDDGQLVIQFPNRIGTQRYLYTGKEIDLIAFCDGGAVGQDTIVSSDRFSTTGSSDKRRYYKGMMSTQAYGNGMRVLQLGAGWGIDDTVIASNNLT